MGGEKSYDTQQICGDNYQAVRSLGRPIAKRMSEILDIEYYDRDLVDEAARKLKLPVSVVDREEESARKLPYNPFTRMKCPLGKGTSETQDAIFEAQENIIRFLAEKETCIIVDAASDFILEEMKNSSISTFTRPMMSGCSRVWKI